jgi:predicted peptidase
MRRITRREAVKLLGAGMAAMHAGAALAKPRNRGKDDTPPTLAAGAPQSPERLELIEDFRKRSEGLDRLLEKRTHKSDWTVPYRLFRPEAKGKLPLILYLCGSGGLGDDNEKQIGLGNIFGTRVWLLPENLAKFPAFVVAPQTDRGWAKYDLTQQEDGKAKVLPGLGDGSRWALEIIDDLRRELPIDHRRIYVAGQSMGGAGVWNVLDGRPDFFAAAIVCCGSRSTEVGAESLATPMWAFHGDADSTVPVKMTRDRIATRRAAGGHPIYTEYPGVDHECWRWAFTEPGLVKWTFAQSR